MKNINKPKRSYWESTQALDLSYLELQENDSIDSQNVEFSCDDSVGLAVEVYE